MKTRYRDTRRWCRGKEGTEHLPIAVRQRPEVRCHRRDRWQALLEKDNPQDPLRYYNAPWECRHEIVCDNCGKVLEDWPAWDRCPDLGASAEGRELRAAHEARRQEHAGRRST